MPPSWRRWKRAGSPIALRRNATIWRPPSATELGCDTPAPQPGCGVTFRYIVQIYRDNPPDDVFVQTATAVALIRAEPRLVGLNLVGPEDYLVARRDYTRQMQIIRFLAGDVPVTLHAGELWLGLVPPADLAFHIRPSDRDCRRAAHRPRREYCLRTRRGGPARADARAAGGGRGQPHQQRRHPRRARQGCPAPGLSRGRRAGRAVER